MTRTDKMKRHIQEDKDRQKKRDRYVSSPAFKGKSNNISKSIQSQLVDEYYADRESA